MLRNTNEEKQILHWMAEQNSKVDIVAKSWDKRTDGVGAQILIQTKVSDGMRGRVSSFWGMIAFGGTSLGSLIIGAAASAWGLQAAVAGAGIACALVSLVTLRRAT